MDRIIPDTRYSDIQPCLHTIVRTEKYEPINANWIGPRFIASSAPTLLEMNRWYSAIVFNSIGMVIMLTPFVERTKHGCRKKADNYLPDLSKELSFGDYIAKSVDSYTKNKIRYTRVYIFSSNREFVHEFLHCHFESWTDMKAPEQSDIQVLTELIETSLKYPRVLVHCSAGLGRTGTFITAAIMTETCMTKDVALSYVRKCRPDRQFTNLKMVTTQEQEDIIQSLVQNCSDSFITSSCTPEIHISA